MLDKSSLVRDFLNRPYKAFLKLTGATGEVSAYGQLQNTLNTERRQRATAYLSNRYAELEIVPEPESLRNAVRSNGLFFDVTEREAQQFWTFDAIESSVALGITDNMLVQPIRFVENKRPSRMSFSVTTWRIALHSRL